MLLGAGADAQLLGEPPRGEAVERHLPGDQTLTPWVHDPSLIGTEASDRFETREVAAEELETVKLTNVVPPIRFASGVAEIPNSTVDELRKILEGLRGRRNVRLHLVGHADTQPLSEALAAVFGDNEGLSRERAGQVAEFLQGALGLPAEAVSYAWAGDTDPVASNETETGRAQNRRVEVEVWHDAVEDAVGLEEILVEQEFRQIKVCRMETVCRLRYMEGRERRTRVQNLIAPLHFSAEAIDVSPQFIEQIDQALRNMSDRQNVLVKFVGYTDDQPLLERDERIYMDHLGLSRARARRVALAVQEALSLPNAAIDSDGRGAIRPIGPNATEQGRALNRRVEVEFWYDDPLQELPDEPQLCPAPGTEIVTRVYDPPWGAIPTVAIVAGEPVFPAGLGATLEHGLGDVADKMRPRLRFVGYTSNETLERRTAVVYGDDIGLSAARARRTMEAMGTELGLGQEKLEFEGRGYLHSDDVVNAGFIQGETSHVVVQIVYDEIAELDDYEGVDVTPIMRELTPENAFALNLMRITVDGEPIDDPRRSSADVQRCTDVALQDADIQFGFDTLQAERRLAVAARPTTLTLSRAVSGSAPPTVRFTMYANYSHFIERAEVRIFEHEQSTEAGPLGVVAVGPDGFADWQPAARFFAAPARELKYVLRAYGAGGTFDETAPQPLYLASGGERVDGALVRDTELAFDGPLLAQNLPLTWTEALLAADEDTQLVANDAQSVLEDVLTELYGAAPGESDGESATTAAEVADAPVLGAPQPSGEPSAAYGENTLALSNIPLASGTVTVRGSAIPPGHDVYVAGHAVPVDAQGNFVAQEILPSGVHMVEVAVLDESGNGELFLRDLEIERNDWFYVGMADLTLAQHDTNGPIELLQGENPTFDYDSPADARLAFFVNGKFGDGWRLSASADTRDAPLEDLFSTFLDKSPEALFRRIDPDYHYPTFGDDGIVEEMAPTLGKFFVELGQGENYGRWGSFNVGYMNNELAQVDRGLYGANLHYQSTGTTSFGDQRFAIDGFTAEPGTIASWEEFRGTGGSLYFLQRQDLLMGSERVRIEFRDRASGLVNGVVNLTPSIDYDIDYLQGRILLTTPLASTTEDDLLVRSGALRGDEAYLVVRYEYSPAFQELDALSVGGQTHYWFGDRVKLGLTANQNDEGAGESSLGAADVTVRMSSDTWVKLQGSETTGLITGTVRSEDGGFGFAGPNNLLFASAEAGGERADVSIGLGDIFDRTQGRLTLYTQTLEGGYSAPGLQTLTDLENYGGTFRMPITERLSVNAKSDRRVQELGLAMDAREIDLGYALDNGWDVSLGVRRDERIDNSPIVPLTQEQGERTDAVVQVGYESDGRWRAYGYAQDTLDFTGNREENARVGTGGSYRISERLQIDAEVSNGDLGAGGRLGTSYLPTERTTLYMNYALENERTDNGLHTPAGSEGNLVAGVKMRLSDSSSVYYEERRQNSDWSAGLTHAAGVNLTPTERLNLSASTDYGILRDMLTGAETDRRAAGVQVGYGFDALQISSGIEYRFDETEQPDLSLNTRETWLFRNNFKYQINPSARLLGKLNHSDSVSSLGQFFDGGYTEGVLGFAYRPVRNDRLNALVKYTYFYNIPTTDQLTLRGTTAEFIQKSHIGSFDLTFDLNDRWSVGGKYAHRIGLMSLDRENPEFFENTANLYVVRADFRFKEDWEGLIEGRLLATPDTSERRKGTVVVISRYMNRHLKLGAGYNFTDFSDDLTDLSFDHRGAFLSITGAM
jgi:flagellar motor protein MotB